LTDENKPLAIRDFEVDVIDCDFRPLCVIVPFEQVVYSKISH